MIFNKRKNQTLIGYEEQIQNLTKRLQTLDPESKSYKETLDSITKLGALYSDEYKRQQFITPETRGNIILRIVGFLGLGGLAFGLARFELGGHLFTGSSADSVKGLLKIGSKLYL